MTGRGFNFGSWRLRLRVPLAMASGFLASLAFPPVDLRWAAFVALVPLALALRDARGRDGLICGAAFGLAFFGVLLGWLSLVGWIAWGATVLALTICAAVFGLLAAWLGRGGAAGRILGWPALFVAVEIARSRFPVGGFTWGALGSSQHSGLPLLPLARVGGMYAISFVIVAANVLIAEAIGTQRRVPRALAVGFAVAIVIAPAWLPLGAPSRTGTMDVAIVQGNVPRNFFTGLRRGRIGPEDDVILENHVRLTETLSTVPPDLVVWPENSIDRDPFHNVDYGRKLQEAITLVRRPMLVGAILDASDDQHFYNSNLLFGADGTLLGRYDKTHLVPFGEYVPWKWARSVVKALDQVPSDGIAGARPVVLQHPNGTRIGAVICFESSYPDLVRAFVKGGAEIIVVETNNATFDRSPLARQHLAQSQMRAVEEGRTVLHAAIAGVSAVIEPDGAIVQEAGLFIPAILRQTVLLASGLTPYARYGDAIESGLAGAGALAALVALALLGLVRRREAMFYAEEPEPAGAFWYDEQIDGIEPEAIDVEPPPTVITIPEPSPVTTNGARPPAEEDEPKEPAHVTEPAVGETPLESPDSP